MKQNSKKSALITGASKGMGRAISLGLASQGYDLAVCARNVAELEALRTEIQNLYPKVNVQIKRVDFFEEGAVEALADWAAEQFPALDVLVNNVGIYERISLLKEEEENYRRGLLVNLTTPHYLSVFFGRRMQQEKKGTFLPSLPLLPGKW